MLNHNFKAITLYHYSCVEVAVRHQSTCVFSLEIPTISIHLHNRMPRPTARGRLSTLPQCGTKTALNSITTAPSCGRCSNNELPALTRQTTLLAPAASPSDRTVATLLRSIALLPTRATISSLLRLSLNVEAKRQNYITG